jgi:hypothetical protein
LTDFFSFDAPYDENTTRDALIQCLHRMEQFQDTDGRFTLKTLLEPPLLATTYSCEENRSGFTIAAGNRIDTYWKIRFSWQARDTRSTQGLVKLDRGVRDIRRWEGDAMALCLQMPDLLEGLASFRVVRSRIREWSI